MGFSVARADRSERSTPAHVQSFSSNDCLFEEEGLDINSVKKQPREIIGRRIRTNTITNLQS
jgi:hypothetical protein